LLNVPEVYQENHSWAEYRERRGKLPQGRLVVRGTKNVDPIGARQVEFLKAVEHVINALVDYWPLTIRQVHYKLLNDPPLTQVTKNRNERWRYQNNLACYSKLSGLLVSARYHSRISFEAIDDSTRESITPPAGFQNTQEFIQQDLQNFLCGYHRDRREGQPHHVEVVVEKNTLLNIVRDVCHKFYVPLTPLRGYGGPSLWERIESRYLDSGKDKCIVIILSDHDPEGLNLVDDCVRSLRDLHNIPVEAIRPIVTMEQVKQCNLPPNWAKEKSTRFREYVRRTGTRRSWECEALDPSVIRAALHEAILSVTDIGQLNAVQEREAAEQDQLAAVKRGLGTRLMDFLNGGEA